jgi:HSP20 family protein
MSQLIRWNPWSTRSLVNEFDRLFDDMLTVRERVMDRPLTWDLPIDVIEDDDAYTVKASVPGIDVDDIEITMNDSVLTIKGEVKEDKEVDDGRYHLRERRVGHFSRSVTLPAAIDANAVEATYENGVLLLNVPKAEEVKPKRIAIKQKKVIEAG